MQPFAVDYKSTTATYTVTVASTKVNVCKIVHTVVYNYDSQSVFVISSTPVVTAYDSGFSYSVYANNYTTSPTEGLATAYLTLDCKSSYGNFMIGCNATITPKGVFNGSQSIL